MNAETARQLFLKVLAGEPLDPAEERDLLETLKSDVPLRNELLDDAELDGWLKARSLGAEDPESLPRSLSYRMEAESRETGFLRKLESRMSEDRAKATRPKTTRRSVRKTIDPSRAWSFGWVAAVILLGFVGLVIVLNSGSTPTHVRKNPTAEQPRPVARTQETPAPQPTLETPRETPKPVELPAPQPLPAPVPQPNPAPAPLEIPKPPTLAPVEKPAPTPEPPKEPRKETLTAIARIEKFDGTAFVRGEPARANQDLLPGDRLETGANGSATVVYPDKTRVELSADTQVRDLAIEGGKRMFVEKGTLRAVVTRQPQPMIFATPHGDATVLGTTLRIKVDFKTQLEVEEGKVRLKNLAGKTTDVVTGQFAIAAAGAELAAKPLNAMELPPRADGLPYDRSCPVIYDNDGCRDTLADQYVLALAAGGDISLRGIITTSIYTPGMTREFITDRNEQVFLGRKGGMKNLPDPVLGCMQPLRRPPSGRIEHTSFLPSEGSVLIIKEARRATPQRPLVVLCGAALTTVATAVLFDNTIADRVVVVTGGKGTTRIDLSGDIWAQYVILEKMRYVHFLDGIPSAEYTEADFAQMPDNEFRRKMIEHLKYQQTPGKVGDGPQLLSVLRPDLAVQVKRVSFSQWVSSELDPAVQVPGVKDDPNGRGWMITQTRQDVATQEYHRALRNPAVWKK